jgi:hypothetical protein
LTWLVRVAGKGLRVAVLSVACTVLARVANKGVRGGESLRARGKNPQSKGGREEGPTKTGKVHNGRADMELAFLSPPLSKHSDYII